MDSRWAAHLGYAVAAVILVDQIAAVMAAAAQGAGGDGAAFLSAIFLVTRISAIAIAILVLGGSAALLNHRAVIAVAAVLAFGATLLVALTIPVAISTTEYAGLARISPTGATDVFPLRLRIGVTASAATLALGALGAALLFEFRAATRNRSAA